MSVIDLPSLPIAEPIAIFIGGWSAMPGMAVITIPARPVAAISFLLNVGWIAVTFVTVAFVVGVEP